MRPAGATAQIAVVEAALGRLHDQLGGQIYPGSALSPDGVLTDGHFVSLGPVVLFASQDREVAGVVAEPAQRRGSGGRLRAPLVPLRHRRGRQQRQGRAALRSHAGQGAEGRAGPEEPGEYIDEGGYVGYVIIVLGASAFLLTLFKAFEILGFEVAPASEVDGILSELSHGRMEAAARKAQQVKGIAGEMLKSGVLHVEESRAVLEELLFEKILGVRPTLERFLPFLAITAAASPLLGLLGTVTGMIKTFQLITIFGTGDAKSLSSGISEALMTTAEGLIVAIPVLILHGALSRMAKRKLGLLEELSVAFINGVDAIRLPRKRLAPTRESAQDD